jgi:hypothetical protein
MTCPILLDGHSILTINSSDWEALRLETTGRGDEYIDHEFPVSV